MKHFIVSEKKEVVSIAQLEIRFDYLINISIEELHDMISTWLQEVVPEGSIEVQINSNKDLRFIVNKPRGVFILQTPMDYAAGTYITVNQIQKSYYIKQVG